MLEAEHTIGEWEVVTPYRNDFERTHRLSANPFSRDVARNERVLREHIDGTVSPDSAWISAAYLVMNFIIKT